MRKVLRAAYAPMFDDLSGLRAFRRLRFPRLRPAWAPRATPPALEAGDHSR